MPRRLPDEIPTKRLLLRRPLSEDAETIFSAYAQDPEVCKYMIWPPHKAIEVTHRFIAACGEAWEIGTRLPYVLADATSNKAVGMLEARVQPTTVDLGYVLARTHWGRGLMPEAIDALARACLSCPDFFRVQATCDVENTASARALEKSAFVREGRLERHTVHPNLSPEPRACFMYARCR
jgi:RimJ/RimL family protein N-acetyltransferase